MKWHPFKFNDSTYDLSHLDNIDHTYKVEMDDKVCEFKCHILFTNHVFTKAQTAETNPLLIYHTDGVARDQREFDFDRYELSKKLPEIIRNIGNKVCKHTGRNNYLRIEVLDENGKKRDYEIYFITSKTANQRGWVTVTIESAYVRDLVEIAKQKKRKLRNIKFSILIRNTMRGKQSRQPPP